MDYFSWNELQLLLIGPRLGKCTERFGNILICWDANFKINLFKTFLVGQNPETPRLASKIPLFFSLLLS